MQGLGTAQMVAGARQGAQVIMAIGLEQGRVMVLGVGVSQGGHDRLAASTGMAAGDRVELDVVRHVPARRGCGFPMVNQTWREGRSSGEGDDREWKKIGALARMLLTGVPSLGREAASATGWWSGTVAVQTSWWS